MEYKNNNQSDSKKLTINSKSIQFMNTDNSLVQSTMIIGWWDNFLTLTLHPALDKNEQRSDRKFNYTVSIIAALSPENMQILSLINDKYIKPALEEKKECIVSLNTANTTLVSLGVKKIDEDYCPFIKISKNINEDRIPEAELTYVFNHKKPIILNYDSSTGKFDNDFILHTEYNFFISMLRPTSIELLGASGHAERYNRRFIVTRIENIIRDLGKKNGIEYGSKYTSRTNPFASQTKSNFSDSEDMEIEDGLDGVPF